MSTEDSHKASGLTTKGEGFMLIISFAQKPVNMEREKEARCPLKRGHKRYLALLFIAALMYGMSGCVSVPKHRPLSPEEKHLRDINDSFILALAIRENNYLRQIFYEGEEGEVDIAAEIEALFSLPYKDLRVVHWDKAGILVEISPDGKKAVTRALVEIKDPTSEEPRQVEIELHWLKAGEKWLIMLGQGT